MLVHFVARAIGYGLEVTLGKEAVDDSQPVAGRHPARGGHDLTCPSPCHTDANVHCHSACCENCGEPLEGEET